MRTWEQRTVGLGHRPRLHGDVRSIRPADDTESIATVHAALDAGIPLLDTGDYYGMGHNELLIREALKGRNRGQVVISVECGALRDPNGSTGGMV